MLLQCFECVDETRTLASLAKQSGLYKSTILRLANSMCKMGFLLRQPSGLFALGPEMARLGSSSRIQVDVEECIRRGLRMLVLKTGESASFHIRQGRCRVCVFLEAGPADDRLVLEEGSRGPLTSGAAAQILRAYGRYTKDPDLTPVRRRGWAASRESRQPDRGAIAIPVFNREKELLGALTVSGTWRHLAVDREQSLRQAALAAARALTAEVRFVHPRDLNRFVVTWTLGHRSDPDRIGVSPQSA